VIFKLWKFEIYFGQPPAGRFFWNDILIASFQSPFSLSRSGSGPRFGASLERGIFGLDDFIRFYFKPELRRRK
jgi:hypothetical protein